MPRWSETIKLVATTETTDELGDVVDTETKRKVYANRKSVRQSEFYQAMANGMQPEIMFEVSVFDYDDEKKLIYNEKAYSVIRTYVTDSDRMEIVCEGLSNNG